jgi:integrase-like protein
MPLAGRVRFLRERTDSGRALSLEEEDKLLDAISRSPSPVLYPFFVLSLDAGLRPSESRALRRSDLTLRWNNGAIAEGEIVVSRSKTDSGTGRVVPLTNRAYNALTVWLSRFPDAGLDSYAFPFHRVGFAGNSRKPLIWDVDLNRPMGQWSYKGAFETARGKSGVACRFYDARHTFVTRLAENPAVSVETIRQLAGHVNDRMLARYAHIRVQARREAIATLERRTEFVHPFEDRAGRAQNWAQFSPAGRALPNHQSEKALNLQDFSLVGAAGFEPATTRTPIVEGQFSSISHGSARYASRACPPRAFASARRAGGCYRVILIFVEGPHKSPHSCRLREIARATRVRRPSPEAPLSAQEKVQKGVARLLNGA